MSNFYMPKQSARNPYFEAMLKEGTNTSPIGAHSQGMSRLAFALLAGLERGQMDREERKDRERTMTRWKGSEEDLSRRPVMPLVAGGDPSSNPGYG